MLRKVTIALLATAALGMLSPDVVSARGGGGGGHGGFGGFHGGFGGFHGFHHFHGGFHDGRFHRGDGFGRGGFHAGNFGRGGFHAGRLAKRMTGSFGNRPEVVRCITAVCSIWQSVPDLRQAATLRAPAPTKTTGKNAPAGDVPRPAFEAD